MINSKKKLNIDRFLKQYSYLAHCSHSPTAIMDVSCLLKGMLHCNLQVLSAKCCKIVRQGINCVLLTSHKLILLTLLLTLQSSQFLDVTFVFPSTSALALIMKKRKNNSRRKTITLLSNYTVVAMPSFVLPRLEE